MCFRSARKPAWLRNVVVDDVRVIGSKLITCPCGHDKDFAFYFIYHGEYYNAFI